MIWMEVHAKGDMRKMGVMDGQWGLCIERQTSMRAGKVYSTRGRGYDTFLEMVRR